MSTACECDVKNKKIQNIGFVAPQEKKEFNFVTKWPNLLHQPGTACFHDHSMAGWRFYFLFLQEQLKGIIIIES